MPNGLTPEQMTERMYTELVGLNGKSGLVKEVADTKVKVEHIESEMVTKPECAAIRKHAGDRKDKVLMRIKDVLYGSSEFSNSDYDTNSKSHILGRFSIAGTKTFEIWHMCSLSYGTRGRGVEVNFGTIEIYTQVWIKKVG